MKKVLMLALGAILVGGVAFAGGKKCKKDGKECCKKEGKACHKDKKEDKAKAAPAPQSTTPAPAAPKS